MMSTIVPIPKGMKSNLKCSENYRPIAISSLFGKVFDKIIISQQHDFLFSSSYQFGFKPHSSTVICSTLLIETIEHYVHNSRQPAYVLLLDTSKAFDRVYYNELFSICTIVAFRSFVGGILMVIILSLTGLSALPRCPFLLQILLQLLSSHRLACHSNRRHSPDRLDFQTHENVFHLVPRCQYCTWRVPLLLVLCASPVCW